MNLHSPKATSISTLFERTVRHELDRPPPFHDHPAMDPKRTIPEMDAAKKEIRAALADPELQSQISADLGRPPSDTRFGLVQFGIRQMVFLAETDDGLKFVIKAQRTDLRECGEWEKDEENLFTREEFKALQRAASYLSEAVSFPLTFFSRAGRDFYTQIYAGPHLVEVNRSRRPQTGQARTAFALTWNPFSLEEKPRFLPSLEYDGESPLNETETAALLTMSIAWTTEIFLRSGQSWLVIPSANAGDILAGYGEKGFEMKCVGLGFFDSTENGRPVYDAFRYSSAGRDLGRANPISDKVLCEGLDHLMAKQLLDENLIFEEELLSNDPLGRKALIEGISLGYRRSGKLDGPTEQEIGSFLDGGHLRQRQERRKSL